MATLAIEQNNAHTIITTTTTDDSNSLLTSKPIKIPLNNAERFSTQLSTGSADSACVVVVKNGKAKKHNSSSSASLSNNAHNANKLNSTQSLNVRSASLSLHGAAHPKSQLQKLKQPAYRQLLSQDSGIDNDRDSTVGSQQQLLKSAQCSSSSSESIGANSSGDLSQSKYSEDNLESEASSGYSGSTHSFGAIRRIKYKSCNSSTTLGCLGLEDRIDEVEDLHDDDDEDDDDEELNQIPALGEDDDDDHEEEDEDDDADDTGLQMSLIPHKESQQPPVPPQIVTNSLQVLQKPEKILLAPKTSTISVPDVKKLPAAVSTKISKASTSLTQNQQVLATDGNYYFPLLNISDDPTINPKLINKKDGLQDCMYYLDEFGSPKLREKYARKQKQKEAKQQIKAKKKLEEESNLQTTNTNQNATKKRQCTLTTQECQVIDEQQQQSTNKSKNIIETHCDTKEKTSNLSYAKKAPTIDCCKTHGGEEGDEVEKAEIATEDDVQNKQMKSSTTPSCVSWTKVMQKFKNILGKVDFQFLYNIG